MRIWIMNHYATEMYLDGAGRHYWFAEKLKCRGHSPAVFCANIGMDREDVIDTGGEIAVADEINGLPFVFVRTVPCKTNGLDRVANMAVFAFNLRRAALRLYKKGDKPDVVIASSVHPLTLVAGLSVAKIMKVPCVCEVRDLWPEALFSNGMVREKSLIGKILQSGEHWIYKRADALVFTKEGDTDYLKEQKWTTEQDGDIDLKKCHYINNGVDIKAFDERAERFKVNDEDVNSTGDFKVVYAGTIRRTNDVGNVLDAAKIIQSMHGYDDIKIIVYGDGLELNDLAERVKNEDITNVKLKGRIDRKYIPYVLKRSSVNVLNYSQGLYNWSRGNSSNKLFEYLASGRPVISTVEMGYSIIKKYKCGVELNEHTANALAKEIIRFHDMPDNDYAEYCANSRRAAGDFDFEVLTDKLESVICDVVNGNRGRVV